MTALQSLYLNVTFFMQNDLFSYASACAFGFLFSFIPVVMLILVVLLRVLHANPSAVSSLVGSIPAISNVIGTLNAILRTNPAISDYINMEGIVTSIETVRSVTNFEVVIGIAIVWMARRFFNSVMGGLRKIFGQEAASRTLVPQLIVLAGEAVTVIIVSALIFITITFRTIVKVPFLSELVARYPRLLGSLSRRLVNVFPYVLGFLAVAVCYKVGSRTRPRMAIALWGATGCIASFWLFQKLMRFFININNYNIVYGVLSNMIVLLMEVFFFFVIFLFFAQLVFVYQFLDTLLLSELYLLPAHDDTSLKATLKRMLFIRPDALLRRGATVRSYRRGEFLYRAGERGDGAYYLVHGTAVIMHPNNMAYVDRGKFFGEEACMLDGVRHEDAQAYTDIQVVRIPEDTLFALLERNPNVSRKAFSQISYYFAKFYGRSGGYSI